MAPSSDWAEVASAYAITSLQERGVLFVEPDDRGV